MTSDGSAHSRFRRALEVRSVGEAEMAAKEMRRIGLLDALDYCALIAAEAPERYDRAARRWLGLLLSECEERLTLDDVQLALACLRNVPAGDVDQLRATLGAMLKRRHALHGK